MKKLTKANVIVASALCGLAFTSVAQAAAYIKFDGVDGESTAQSVSWGEAAVAAPRDAASGMATGKRQHKPVRVTSEMDKASPMAAPDHDLHEGTPRAASSSGMATGKRQHKPVSVTRPVDAATPASSGPGSVVMGGQTGRCVVGAQYPSATIVQDSGAQVRLGEVTVTACAAGEMHLDYGSAQTG